MLILSITMNFGSIKVNFLFFLSTAKNIVFNDNGYAQIQVLCLRLLADVHLNLHAFTLAEYYYVKSNTVNLNFVQSLIYQNIPAKSQEAISLIQTVESNSELNDDDKTLLIEVVAKYEPFFMKIFFFDKN